jgi:hypothetical protein
MFLEYIDILVSFALNMPAVNLRLLIRSDQRALAGGRRFQEYKRSHFAYLT